MKALVVLALLVPQLAHAEDKDKKQVAAADQKEAAKPAEDGPALGSTAMCCRHPV